MEVGKFRYSLHRRLIRCAWAVVPLLLVRARELCGDIAACVGGKRIPAFLGLMRRQRSVRSFTAF